MKTITKEVIAPGSRVFVRCDLDVPIKNGVIEEKYRLESALPTLKLIIAAGGLPVIAGHIGKPDGRPTESLSTKQLLPFFINELGQGAFELLENLRFDPREEANDDMFARELASKVQVYVNESFATSHRKHTSFVGVPRYTPAYAGLHLTQEVAALGTFIKDPPRPLTVIIGGAKLESKKPVASKFLQVADAVLLGGKLGLAWQESVPANLHLPVDYAHDSKDIGPKTIERYTSIIAKSRSVLWAGPLGLYEDPAYIVGTQKVGEAVVSAIQSNGLYAVAGGGDTITALEKTGLLSKMSFVSVAGGAMLEFLANGTLPGLEALDIYAK